MQRYIWFLALLVMTGQSFGASYSIQTNAAAESVLDEAQTTTHQGQTKLQILQRATNAFLQNLFAQQNAHASRELDDKLKVATNAAKVNARTALNAGISLPVITEITDQGNNIGQSPVIPIVATDPDSLPLRFSATGLPNGMAVTTHVTTGAPQITGTLTTAGTFNVTVFAHKFSDIFDSETFQWIVSP